VIAEPPLKEREEPGDGMDQPDVLARARSLRSSRDPHPFFVPPSCFAGDGETIRFPEEEMRHILRVIRLREGDECRVTDGRGGVFRVRLGGEPGGGARGVLSGTIIEAEHAPPRDVMIEIGFPVLRLQGRTDWLIEKAVEVGADLLVPIPWERSLKGASAAALRRWERIAREAMKQCERAWLPEVKQDLMPFERGDDSLWILADPEGDESVPDLVGVSRVRLLVGPEGGPTPAERKRLIERGAALWGLGPTRLRAETAAIVGCHAIARGARRQRETSEQR
jgi:16S rRNA (uracil1498-N3)-methyltransferase